MFFVVGKLHCTSTEWLHAQQLTCTINYLTFSQPWSGKVPIAVLQGGNIAADEDTVLVKHALLFPVCHHHFISGGVVHTGVWIRVPTLAQ